MTPLLFLDIDGVLNTHEPLDPEVMCGQIHEYRVVLLNEILRQTDARLVISSAWRYLIHRGEMNLTGFEWLLRSHGIMAGRMHGITREDHMRESPEYDGKSWPVHNERGQQITEYMSAFPGVRYAVVDDLDLGISEAGHPFVKTDGAVGLRSTEAMRLIELLISQS